MNKLLVILGPTATGKTDLAIQLAGRFNGELIAADSRQVYTGLDIGTGKLPGKKSLVEKYDGYWVINGIRIWMYDVVSLKKQYTVADYVKCASKITIDIKGRSKIPIIVGGTGLYIKALLEGLSNLNISFDKKLRDKLNKLSLDTLQEELQKINTRKWENLNYSDQQNSRRLIRAIELTLNKSIQENTGGVGEHFDVLKIGLIVPKEILYEKINIRAEKWIKEGITNEVKGLIKNGIPKKRFRELGLEYSLILKYLEGNLSNDELLKQIKLKVRQYAKRQITWFKKEKDVMWFDITSSSYKHKLVKKISDWYNKE